MTAADGEIVKRERQNGDMQEALKRAVANACISQPLLASETHSDHLRRGSVHSIVCIAQAQAFELCAGGVKRGALVFVSRSSSAATQHSCKVELRDAAAAGFG